MKIKNIFKVITFILLSGALLLSLSGCSKNEEIVTSSNLEVDTSFDTTLTSINNVLERNEQYEQANSVIKNVKFDSSSYTYTAFGYKNNDKQIMNESNKRLAEIEKKFPKQEDPMDILKQKFNKIEEKVQNKKQDKETIDEITNKLVELVESITIIENEKNNDQYVYELIQQLTKLEETVEWL